MQRLETALSILKQTQPNNRSEAQIRSIYECLKNVKFFKELEEEYALECCARIYLENFKKDQLIFQYMDEGFTFYIILQGSVGILVPKDAKLAQELFFQYEKKHKKKTNNQNENPCTVIQFYECVVLQAGASFGEIALIKKKKRQAGVVAKDDCSMAVLSKYDYNEVLAKIENQKIERTIDFFASIKFFQH